MGNSRRLKRAMKANRVRRLGAGYRGVKMPEVLVQFAAPLLRGLTLPKDRDAFTAALKMAGLLWNEVASPHPEGSAALYASLSTGMSEPRDLEMEALFDRMIARGRVLFPGLDRLVTGVDVDIEDDGRCNVRVISAVSI